MNTKIQSIIKMAGAIKYDSNNCFMSRSPIFMNKDEPWKGGCHLEHDCKDCIFNGLNQPDYNTLDILIMDLKHEQIN